MPRSQRDASRQRFEADHRVGALDRTNGLKAGYFNATLARGLQILTLFNEHQTNLTLADVARLAAIDRATALRFLSTLCQLGYLDRSAVTKSYRLALATLELGYVGLSSSRLVNIARPYLEDLSARINETVNLGVLSGREVLYIHRIARVELLTVSVFVGSRLPLHSTSMGKVLLAHLPVRERTDILDGYTLMAFGPNTILDKDRLKRELDKIERHGYALQDEESSAGLRGIAAPVRGPAGGVVAAINIAVPAVRVTNEELMRRFRPMIVTTSLQISNALIGPDPGGRRTEC